MLVGTTNLDYKVLKSFVGKPDDLVVYVDGLVPVWARHITCLTHNQRFYVAIHLRGVLTIPYKPRMELVEALIKGVKIRGIVSSFTSITDVVNACDKKALVEMIRQKIENE